MICVILYILVFSGCGRDVSVLKNGTMEESSGTEYTDDNDIENQDAENQDTENQDTEDQDINKEQKNVETEKNNSDTNHSASQESGGIKSEKLIYVDVGGAVVKPGVYSLSEGSRVFEVLELAGGFTKDAYTKAINQAEILLDGEKIYVYTTQEAEELLAQGMFSEFGVWLESGSFVESGSLSEGKSSAGKVNLNKADKEELMTLSGIGSTRADAILQYRTEHGAFRSIEELMQVEGIKEKTYEKIKDCITVQ